MLRKAKEEDLPQVLKLWSVSFNEDENFNNWYFDNVYKADNTIVYEDNGMIIAMLQMLPYEITNLGKVSYIFGACTMPEYRGKGIMASLIAYSEELDRQSGIKASILIPQNESLFNFYDRFGYEPYFKIASKDYSVQMKKDHPHSFLKCTTDDIAQLNRLYEDSLFEIDYVKRTESDWETQINMFKALGGDTFCLKDNNEIVGYAFVWNEETPLIQELAGKTTEIKDILANEILRYYSKEKAQAFILDGIPTQLLGSIKFYDKQIKKLYYMNLMFN